ncbi:hypothetical protein [Lentilactobacillus kisonensis]|uniref:Uncharacterized protein n=2 Tax=Lentilactobacillus kisonensis TaxID=481722 RepID=H1LFZ8_9LACO|nr:hypothetical protein [Lentilactobacillus kisonensis]EHO51204.1 hypothetical protein HMPREF9104_01524 [Lentilactobacillus kisonensis F0435]KRL20355.1 hypothetical protein FC98_GL001577 [Lentilactobacillus kisonensis DSM 19906 = JCM 15041]
MIDLQTDANELTIMGVKFKNREDYQATLSSIASNMYEGYVPTKSDIGMLVRNSNKPLSTDEAIAYVKNKHAKISSHG